MKKLTGIDSREENKMSGKADLNRTADFEWLGIENRPVIFSGPCSAETEEQVLETAMQLKEAEAVHVFRAGVWKPRTRPDSFEGVGTPGLSWLQKVKAFTGLKVTTEVATAYHVQQCLEHDIDILWIGARTTANPFAVQEIARALKGVDIPVFIKNPINPDLSLWFGAVERLQRAGIDKIGAIHRGFSDAGEKIYRNKPLWEIAIDFKQEMSGIPLLCDPSHICGNRELLASVAQKSMDLQYDGLMIEAHITPDQAWSDAAQQITPVVTGELLKSLVIRKENPADTINQSELEYLRKEMDMLDDQLIRILVDRMKLSQAIGHYKRENNMTILQTNRWREVFDKYVSRAEKEALSQDFIARIIKAVHDESINEQARIINSGKTFL